VSTERGAIQARTRSDGLRLLRAINDTQAHGQEGARVYPPRAAQEARIEVGSERYEDAMAYLTEQAALRADERTAFDEDIRDQHLRGNGLCSFTRRALKLLDGLDFSCRWKESCASSSLTASAKFDPP
jgi:hypothetical protein